MRVLFTVDPEIPVPPRLYGGIERIVDSLTRELRSRGYAIGLVANPESTCEVEEFFPWSKACSGGWKNGVRNSMALGSAVRKFQPQVIHSFSRLGYLLPLLPFSLPKVMSYQRYTGGRQIQIGARLAGKSLVFTGCSEFVAAMGRPWGGDWRAIHNFTDTNYYQFAPTVEAEAPLLFLSRIERIKGAHTAISIAQGTGRRLVIAGNQVKEGDGPAYWRNEIAPHIDGHNVKYVGPVADAQKRELLREAAALVVPVEWNEPFGIVFVEALACGTPVISCPRGALTEIIEDGLHGFLINSVTDGVAAVKQLGTISRRACRARAEQQFSVQVVASEYENLYRQMISRN